MPRITAIETVIPSGIMPNLVLVRVHTDAGLVGCGETYYTPHAIAELGRPSRRAVGDRQYFARTVSQRHQSPHREAGANPMPAGLFDPFDPPVESEAGDSPGRFTQPPKAVAQSQFGRLAEAADHVLGGGVGHRCSCWR